MFRGTDKADQHPFEPYFNVPNELGTQTANTNIIAVTSEPNSPLVSKHDQESPAPNYYRQSRVDFH